MCFFRKKFERLQENDLVLVDNSEIAKKKLIRNNMLQKKFKLSETMSERKQKLRTIGRSFRFYSTSLSDNLNFCCIFCIMAKVNFLGELLEDSS